MVPPERTRGHSSLQKRTNHGGIFQTGRLEYRGRYCKTRPAVASVHVLHTPELGRPRGGKSSEGGSQNFFLQGNPHLNFLLPYPELVFKHKRQHFAFKQRYFPATLKNICFAPSVPTILTLAGVVQRVGRRPTTERLPVWFLAEARAWIAGQVFVTHIDVSLPLFLPPFPSL